LSIVTFKTYGGLGDVIYALPGIRQACSNIGRKASLYIPLDVPSMLYEGAVHPTKDASGNTVTVNRKMFDMIQPLLKQQDYIEDVEIFQGQKIHVDLTRLYTEDVNMPWRNIAKWPVMLYPDMASDLSKQWLYVSAPTPEILKVTGRFIVNQTERYNNPLVDYFFLKDFEQQGFFVGTEEEHSKFNKKWVLDIEYLPVRDFLQLAQYISSCKFFMGGQSFTFSLAEALKIPRILQICRSAANVQPVGGECYEYLYQDPLEYYFQKLIQ